MRAEAERELITHFAALRALARDLVGDRDAEDLVQDTALQALSRGPTRPGALGGWLRTVARRLAGRRRRAECRRERRERQVARAESVPPPQDDVVRRETFRAVSEAVLALAEPYQRTVLLRYLEDLTPQAIATRTGASVATVKSRLQRGLALLRERLDRDHRRTWRPALIGTFGLGARSAAATVAGMVLMGTAAKWMFGGAAALLALGVMWLGKEPEPLRTAAVQAAGQEPPLAAEAAPWPDVGAPDAAYDRREVELSDATPARASKLAGIAVTGTVRSRQGGTIAGAYVGLRRHDQMCSGKTEGNGSYTVADLQTGDWQLSCGVEGFAKYEAEVTLDERAVQPFDIELRPVYVVKVKVQNAAGESLPDLVDRRMSGAELGVVATAEPLSRDLPLTERMFIAFGAGEWRTNSGSGRNQDAKLRKEGFAGVLQLDRDPPVHAALLLRHAVLQRQRIEPGQHEVTFTLEASEVLDRVGSLSLRLLDDATGVPLPGARVSVNGVFVLGPHGGQTDADGRFTEAGQPPGLVPMMVWLEGYEQVFRTVRMPERGNLDLGEIRLSRVITITAVTVDADGQPVTGLDLAWTCLDDRTFPRSLRQNMSAPVNAAGQCKLGLGRHRYVVIAHGKGRYGYAAVDLRGGEPVPLTIPVAQPIGVALRMHADTTVGYLLTISDLRGVPARALWLGGEHRPPGTSLPSGSYRVDIHDGDDRLVRSFPLDVTDRPVTIDVP